VQRKHALLPATLARPHPANTRLPHDGGREPFARARAAVFRISVEDGDYVAEVDGPRWRRIREVVALVRRKVTALTLDTRKGIVRP